VSILWPRLIVYTTPHQYFYSQNLSFRLHWFLNQGWFLFWGRFPKNTLKTETESNNLDSAFQPKFP
jgi:hypothetical protein